MIDAFNDFGLELEKNGMEYNSRDGVMSPGVLVYDGKNITEAISSVGQGKWP